MAKLRVVIDDLNRFIDQVMAALATEVVKNLTAAPSEGGTPIDTGWASANWIPYIGSPDRSPVGERPTARNSANRGRQEQAVAALTRYKRSAGDIVIANNVPYIVRLNDGSSAQAPSGFVQKAIVRAVRGVATA